MTPAMNAAQQALSDAAEPVCKAYFANCTCKRTGRHKIHHCALDRCGGQWTGTDPYTDERGPKPRVWPGRRSFEIEWMFQPW